MISAYRKLRTTTFGGQAEKHSPVGIFLKYLMDIISMHSDLFYLKNSLIKVRKSHKHIVVGERIIMISAYRKLRTTTFGGQAEKHSPVGTIFKYEYGMHTLEPVLDLKPLWSINRRF